LAYDAEGRFEQITHYASLGTEVMVAFTDYRHDEFGRLTGLTHYQDLHAVNVWIIVVDSTAMAGAWAFTGIPNVFPVYAATTP
jgi:hypothetical protein